MKLSNSKEITAEQAEAHIDKFTPIYNEKGETINKIPENTKLTVYCKGSNQEGFLINATDREMGIEIFIAKKWILHEELVALCSKNK